MSLRDDARDLAIPEPERVWSGTALVLCPSRAVRDRAVEAGWPAERIEVLELPPTSIPRRPAREPRADGRVRLLSFGPLIWEHGLEHAVHGRRAGPRAGRRLPAADRRHRRPSACGGVRAPSARAGRRTSRSSGRRTRAALADELADADVLSTRRSRSRCRRRRSTTAQELASPSSPRIGRALPTDHGVAVERRDPAGIADAIVRLAIRPGAARVDRRGGPPGDRTAARRASRRGSSSSTCALRFRPPTRASRRRRPDRASTARRAPPALEQLRVALDPDRRVAVVQPDGGAAPRPAIARAAAPPTSSYVTAPDVQREVVEVDGHAHEPRRAAGRHVGAELPRRAREPLEVVAEEVAVAAARRSAPSAAAGSP